MNQDYGQLEPALKLTKEGKQSCDLRGIVFIDAVEADQGIEDQEDRAQFFNGVSESGSIGGGVQA